MVAAGGSPARWQRRIALTTWEIRASASAASGLHGLIGHVRALKEFSRPAAPGGGRAHVFPASSPQDKESPASSHQAYDLGQQAPGRRGEAVVRRRVRNYRWLPVSAQATSGNSYVPDGIRTRVTGLKGQRPGPLDDGDGFCESRGARTPDPRLKRPVLYQLS